MDRPPVARLSGVDQRYGASVALESVDIALPAGCMVGLIGPDGWTRFWIRRYLILNRRKMFNAGYLMPDAGYLLRVAVYYCPGF